MTAQTEINSKCLVLSCLVFACSIYITLGSHGQTYLPQNAINLHILQSYALLGRKKGPQDPPIELALFHWSSSLPPFLPSSTALVPSFFAILSPRGSGSFLLVFPRRPGALVVVVVVVVVSQMICRVRELRTATTFGLCSIAMCFSDLVGSLPLPSPFVSGPTFPFAKRYTAVVHSFEPKIPPATTLLFWAFAVLDS